MQTEPILDATPPGLGQLLGGLVLMCASLSVAPLAVVVARKLFPGRNIFFARWGFSHIGFAALAFLVLTTVVALVAKAAHADEQLAGLPGVLVSAAMFACVAALVVVFARRLDPDGWRCLGLRPSGNLRAMFAGVIAYAAAFPGLIGAGMAWPWLLDLVHVEHAPQDVGELALQLHGGELVVFACFAVLVQPLLEELLFRAFLQPLLVQNLGDRGGVAVTSVVFAALHGVSAFFPVCLLAIVLGSVMLRTQRLSAVWLVHAMHNGLMLAALLLAPGAREFLGQ